MHCRPIFMIILVALCDVRAVGEETVVVRPTEIDAVLVNPGIGFMTFQRFNGDALNEGKKWTEGYPIEYQPFDGDVMNKKHPQTSLAYFRIYWKYIHPEKERFAWDLIDKALETARSRGQTLLLRIAPYGTGDNNDVPEWYRAMIGPEKQLPVEKWRTDPEDQRYVKFFGGMIRKLGQRYDGHPNLESVDLSIVGAWGEGAGSAQLTQKTREALVNCYVDSFKKTPLLMLLTDEKTNKYGLSKANVGWRVDCLGDMGGFSSNWSHMNDYYPQAIINFGMRDAWQEAPVSLEVCWVMQHWLDKGWDVDHIIDESLKWHISSFNAKSSPVPEKWQPQVNRWLKRMGYRFVLRKWTHSNRVRPGGTLNITSWWENKGVAPCYRFFPLAIRLTHGEHSVILITDADIRRWLPGDNLFDCRVRIPSDLPEGPYDLEIGLVDPENKQPKIRLAIEGRTENGWYPMDTVQVAKPKPAE